ncbi:MAG: hypothetical protein H0T87_05815 [Gammaproteobacteria bacterium]|nr:hypothetical protein [Gammaproteobacteria bacterium]
MSIVQRLKDKVDEINHSLARNKTSGKAQPAPPNTISQGAWRLCIPKHALSREWAPMAYMPISV